MTIVTNFMIYYGAFCVVALALMLVQNDIPVHYFAPPYLAGVVLLVLSLYFQWKKKTYWARLCAVFLLNFMGWQAAAIYGTTFNGYLVFFPAIVYSVIAFSKASPPIKWTALSVSMLGLPLIDILSHREIFPLTGLNSRDFSVSILLLDTIVITLFLATITSIEKMFYDRYESQLEGLNSNLEAQVQERTDLLLEAKEKVLQTEIVKSQLISNTSHELRTPLQGLSGFLNLAKKRIDKIESVGALSDSDLKKMKNSLNLAQKSATRLEKIILPILEISSNHNPHQLRPTEFEIQEAIEAILLKTRFEIQKKGLLIDIQISPKKLKVVSDKALVSLVLEHLILNAVQYAFSQSTISISIQIGEGNFHVSISNQGVGIEDSEEELIFQPFFQGSRTDQKIGGKGLGLFLSRKYARELGGEIRIGNLSREKTTFQFTFPSAEKVLSEKTSFLNS